jgi:DNA-binding response OmpR family regulator
VLILVVEDDASVSRFVVRGLREEGYVVDLCASGDEALTQATRHPYALILLDWMLPGLDGLELLRRWRAAGVDAPVIMLTARGGTDAVVGALDAGADDYLSKPFSFEELLARVRARLRRAQGDAEVVAIGAARVDLRRRVVRRADLAEPVELTAREFALLDELLRRRGEVVSRAVILDRVWGVSHDTSTNLVDVYVGHLRRKLDAPDAASSVIETVRGRGYRLAASGDEEVDP